MAKITLNDVNSGLNQQSIINSNQDTIEEHFDDKVLYRDNPTGEANQMENLIDMNSNRIINLPDPVDDADAVRRSWVTDLVTGVGAGTVGVIGPSSAGPSNIVLFDGATGQVIKDSGITLPAGTNHYELGTTAAAASHAGVTTGHTIETNYIDSNRTGGSGSKVEFTGTTTVGKAGNWPDTDGFFYDALGQQFGVSGEFGSVKWFGAIGDGATNDTVAIATTMAAVTVVYFPAGTYLTNKITTSKANLLFIGDGEGSTTLKLRDSRNEHLVDNSQDYFGLEKLTLDGNKANQSSNSYCLVQRDGVGARVRFCIIKDAFTHNFMYIANTFSTMSNTTSQGSANSGGIVGQNGSTTTDHLFSNCYFKDNLVHGLVIGAAGAPVRRVQVDACSFTGGGRHTNLNGGGGCWVVDDARYVTLNGCLAHDNLGDGLSTHGGIGVTFTGCYSYEAGIADPGGTPEPNNGFVASDSSTNIVFVGCHAYLNTANGFTIGDNTVNVAIDACHAWNNSQISAGIWSGIMFTDAAGAAGSGAQYAKITDCLLFDTQGGGATQDWGIGITSTGNPPTNTTISDNTMYGNVSGAFNAAQVDDDTRVKAHDNIGYNPVGSISAPTLTYGSGIKNQFPHGVWVYLTGGSISAVNVGATVTGLTSGIFYVDVNQTIQVNGSGATWVWQGI